MPASSDTVTLPSGVDLHARPAAEFVKAALGFHSAIEIEAAGRTADAKSLLSVLGLGARGGTALELRADGDDAGTAVSTLSGVVAGLSD